jgi:hypothetical protein
MHILRPLQQLLHVQLDVAWLELDALVFKPTREIVVHVWEDHVHGQRVRRGAAHDEHVASGSPIPLFRIANVVSISGRHGES